MKKTSLALGILVALSVSSVALANSVPVTDFSAGSAKANLGYSFNRDVGGLSDQDGLGISLELGLQDRLAGQFAYHKINLPGKDLEDHQLNAVYKYNENFNLYGGLTYIDAGDDKLGFQAGVIGHKQFGDKVTGFAKAGLGNDLEFSFQVGGKYALRDNVDLNLYYEQNNYDLNGADFKDKGLHVGVGYSF